MVVLATLARPSWCCCHGDGQSRLIATMRERERDSQTCCRANTGGITGPLGSSGQEGATHRHPEILPPSPVHLQYPSPLPKDYITGNSIHIL